MYVCVYIYIYIFINHIRPMDIEVEAGVVVAQAVLLQDGGVKPIIYVYIYI